MILGPGKEGACWGGGEKNGCGKREKVSSRE